MEAYLAKDANLKKSSQRAFVSYIKSVYLMKDKSLFSTQSLDLDSFAHSLGLAISPRIRFIQRMKKETDNTLIDTNIIQCIKIKGIEKDEETNIISKRCSLNYQNGKRNQVVTTEFLTSDCDDSDDEVLKVKRKDHDITFSTKKEIVELHKNKKPLSKASVVKKIIKKNIVPNKKVLFSDEGEAISVELKEKKSQLAIQYEQENSAGINIEMAKIVLEQEDQFDKHLFKTKVKAKHKDVRRKLKAKKKCINDFSEREFEEPYISWLPDPDKIYGEKSEATNESKLKSNIGFKSTSKKVKRYV